MNLFFAAKDAKSTKKGIIVFTGSAFFALFAFFAANAFSF